MERGALCSAPPPLPRLAAVRPATAPDTWPAWAPACPGAMCDLFLGQAVHLRPAVCVPTAATPGSTPRRQGAHPEPRPAAPRLHLLSSPSFRWRPPPHPFPLGVFPLAFLVPFLSFPPFAPLMLSSPPSYDPPLFLCTRAGSESSSSVPRPVAGLPPRPEAVPSPSPRAAPGLRPTDRGDRGALPGRTSSSSWPCWGSMAAGHRGTGADAGRRRPTPTWTAVRLCEPVVKRRPGHGIGRPRAHRPHHVPGAMG